MTNILTYELVSDLCPCSELLFPQDDGIDSTQQCHHVWHVVCVGELVHYDAESILLVLHTLLVTQLIL